MWPVEILTAAGLELMFVNGTTELNVAGGGGAAAATDNLAALAAQEYKLNSAIRKTEKCLPDLILKT